MTTVERTFTTTAPPQRVVDYLADFTNAIEWDPGTQSCERHGSGPVAEGASWRNVSTFLGRESELTYTLEEYTSDSVVLVGKNTSATSTDTITVRPHGTGSEVTYHVDLQLHGAAKLGVPLVKAEFERLASKTQEQLSGVLDELA